MALLVSVAKYSNYPKTPRLSRNLGWKIPESRGNKLEILESLGILIKLLEIVQLYSWYNVISDN